MTRGPAKVRARRGNLDVIGTVSCLCGASVDIAEVKPSGEPCILHPFPTCKDFDERDPGSLLQAIRSREQGSA